MRGEVILQFCGLRSKCYSLVTENEHKMAAAGVKKAKQSFFKHHHYLEVLADFSVKYVRQRAITSKNHVLYTQEQIKKGLSALDIKRFILPDGICTVPHGYFALDEIN